MLRVHLKYLYRIIRIFVASRHVASRRGNVFLALYRRAPLAHANGINFVGRRKSCTYRENVGTVYYFIILAKRREVKPEWPRTVTVLVNYPQRSRYLRIFAL